MVSLSSRSRHYVVVALTLSGCGGTVLDAGSTAGGGVVYSNEARSEALEGALVELTDSTGSHYSVRTDALGRFEISARDWSPKYPILAAVTYGKEVRRMESPIVEAAPCSNCHENGVFLRTR